ncbi:MAG: hypothetical protein R3F61_00475 [Myxococcota bacterium]
MALEHAPNDGVSVEEDLSGTRITLTRQRGGAVFAALLVTFSMLGLGWLTDGGIGSYTILVLMGAGFALNALKSELVLTSRALTVETRVFGRITAREIVPYEAITAMTPGVAAFGVATLTLERLDGPPVVLRHGTAEDLAEVARQIEAHRSGPASPEEIAEPPELRALRAARATKQ